MNTIAGLPYMEAKFDKTGKLQSPISLPNGVTDLFVMSHGWNNDDEEARTLYTKFFTNFVKVAQPDDLPRRTFAVIGVIWPSKKFDERIAVSGVPGDASGAAAVAADRGSQKALDEKLDRMKATFTEPAQLKAIEDARALLPDLDDKATARRTFVNLMRSLLDPTAANGEDRSDSFFKDDGEQLMQALKVDEDDLDPEIDATPGGTASLPQGGGRPRAIDADGAAGLKDVLSKFKASAMNILNYTTYYEMKARAGKVGTNGVARIIDDLGPKVQRIHLVGHSFGGRVVTAAAAGSRSDKISSMALLQTAFSHNGFSKSKKGFFRGVVDQQRVKGPILVTHTKNDKAVGIAYPLASRMNGDTTATLGDEHDEFGGIGRNGAQQMEQGEVVNGNLLAKGGSYSFTAGKFFNLEGSRFIDGHGAVTGEEIAHAVRRAIV
jgi:hypothetical protein